MKSENLKVEYFRFVSAPENPQGTVFTPVMGEVEAGRIYPALEPQAAVLRAHPEWEAVSKQEYDTQDGAPVQQDRGTPRRAFGRNPASVEAGDTSDQGATDGQE